MKITSTGIENGYYKPIYGGNGDLINENGMPTYSIPFTIHEAPADTGSYDGITDKLFDIIHHKGAFYYGN